MSYDLTIPLTPGLAIGPPEHAPLGIGKQADLVGNNTFHGILLEQMKPTDRSEVPGNRRIGAVLPEQEAELRALLPEAQQAEIREAAVGIESWLFYTLFKEMWATIPEDGLLNTGMAGEFYREMYLEEISQSAASQNNGVNIDKIIELQIMAHEASAEIDKADLPEATPGFALGR